jgi:hypothetical protein
MHTLAATVLLGLSVPLGAAIAEEIDHIHHAPGYRAQVEVKGGDCFITGDDKFVTEALCAALKDIVAPGAVAKITYDVHRFSNTATPDEVTKSLRGHLGSVMSEHQIQAASKSLHSAITSRPGRIGSLSVAVGSAGIVILNLMHEGDAPSR